jgi:hypothetical protein
VLLNEEIIKALINNTFSFNQFQPNVDQCRMENQQPDTRAKTLTLIDMTSCFIVLAFGYSISVFVFLSELTYYKIDKRLFRRQQKTRNVFLFEAK